MAAAIVTGIVLVSFLVYFVVKKFKWMRDAENSTPAVQKEKMEQDLADLENAGESFEKDFFRRCENGESSVLFMKIASLQDCSVLRSFLYSADIPSYVESEHSSGMYGNAADVNVGLIAMQLYVLEDDYEEAVEIAKDFIKRKPGNKNEDLTETVGLKIYPRA